MQTSSLTQNLEHSPTIHRRLVTWRVSILHPVWDQSERLALEIFVCSLPDTCTMPHHLPQAYNHKNDWLQDKAVWTQSLYMIICFSSLTCLVIAKTPSNIQIFSCPFKNFHVRSKKQIDISLSGVALWHRQPSFFHCYEDFTFKESIWRTSAWNDFGY